VALFDGDLDDYRRLVLSERRGNARPAARESARASRADMRRAAAAKRAELAPLRARIATLETAVERLSQEVEQLDRVLATPGLFERDPAKAASLAKARAEAARALAQAEEDWLTASSDYEAAMR
jgi:ATP-binding cassette subfamily F protein 3